MKERSLFSLVLALLSVFFITGIIILAFNGCAQNQSAFQQIKSQTSDPELLSKAAYADALGAYVAAQEVYKPYIELAKATHPDLAEEIRVQFGEARKILNTWEKLGTIPSSDENNFREYIRDITLKVALMIEEQNKKEK